MGLLDRLRQATEGTEATAMRGFQERRDAAQQGADALEGTPYKPLVRTHLRGALKKYATVSVEFVDPDEMLANNPTMADLKRGAAAAAEMNDAITWLGALLGTVRRAAIRLSDEEMETFNAETLAQYADGIYRLDLASTGQERDLGGHDFAVGTAIVEFGFAPDTADELALKVENVGPQEVLANVGLDDAARVKSALELHGLQVRIKEGRSARLGGHRDPIPESVRHEVWRRAEARCVDCGSRERLEFDHIIPLSQGGSNTARNLELRCESCNRRKGATI